MHQAQCSAGDAGPGQGRRTRRDGKPWVSFRELEAKHQRLVEESSEALRRQKAEIDRRGQEVFRLTQQVKALHQLIFLLVDDLTDEDQHSLAEDPALGEAHVIWTSWRDRTQRAEQEAR